MPCSLRPCRDGYLPGAQALARSLRKVGSRHPLLVIYTADTLSSAAVAALEAEPGCKPLAVERYVPPGGVGLWEVGRHLCWRHMCTFLPSITLPARRAARKAFSDWNSGQQVDNLHHLRPFHRAACCIRGTAAGMHDFGAYKLQLYAECWTKLRLWELEQFER